MGELAVLAYSKASADSALADELVACGQELDGLVDKARTDLSAARAIGKAGPSEPEFFRWKCLEPVLFSSSFVASLVCSSSLLHIISYADDAIAVLSSSN